MPRMSSRTPVRSALSLAALGLFVLGAGGCSTSYWVAQADEEVGAILGKRNEEFERFRREEVVDPRELPADPDADAEPTPEELADVPRVVGLKEALEVAVERNRSYLSERESLYLAALNLTTVLNDFSPFFAGTVSALLAGDGDTDRLHTSAAALSVSQILPTGGAVAVTGGAGAVGGGGAVGGYEFDSDVRVDFEQPLLRGAGYETSHEALTQAERDVIYAIRDFELFRQDFTIDVMSQYYALVRQQREIVNAERDLEARQFLMAQSEAKFNVGLATEVDKLRAEREFLRAQNDLLQLRESWQFALDRFKILLGLPTSFPLEIRAEEPDFREVAIDLTRAVEAALHNRVDLLTARDRLQDAERAVRIQTNRMLPDLDLTASYGRSTIGVGDLSDLRFENYDWTLGLSLTLPLERTSERNALRRAIIDLERERRDVSLSEDQVILDVRDSLRRLRRAETTLEIRRREIEVARKEAEAARIRFEAGEMDNRNVTDAQNAVLRAENAYIADLVEYAVARIELMRAVGILFIDEDGMWVEP